jgi:hypothetical protein
MSRLAPFFTFCSALLAAQAQAEICLSQNARSQWGVPFNGCQVFDVIRQAVGRDPNFPTRTTLEIGGDQDGPWITYWIEIGPVDQSLTNVDAMNVSLIESSTREIVCRSRDLSQFVKFGGRVNFDFDLLMPPRSELALAERGDLTTLTVETCEAD